MTSGSHPIGLREGRLRVPRSRGALSGLLLMVLGVWGGLIPFLGPVFHYSYTPDVAWTWTSGRFWLSVLPGAATLVAGFLVATTANRAVGVFAGYLGSAAGAWFIVGPVFGPWISGTGMAPGTPTGGPSRMVVEQIGFYSGLGAAVLFLAAQALGRFTVRSVLEVRAAERHERGMTAGGHRDTGAYPAGPDEPAATREIRPGEVHRT